MTDTANPASATLVDRAEMLRLLGTIVDRKGADYVYERVASPETETPHCVNFDYQAKFEITEHGQIITLDLPRVPSCIVGHVYAELGLLELVSRASGAATMFSTLIVSGYPVQITQAAVNVALMIQICQDDGWPWGEALELVSSNPPCGDDTKPWSGNIFELVSVWDEGGPGMNEIVRRSRGAGTAPPA